MEAAFQSAYASTLLQNVIKLIGCIIAEYKRFQRSEEAIRKLETTTIRARNLFSSINTFQLDDSIRLCLQDRLDTMAILCLDIEDLIEDILDAVTQNSSSKKPILNFMLKHPTRQYDIDDLQRKLDKVHEEVKSIVELTSQTRAQNSSCNGDPGMKSLMPLIGREEDITNIIQKITSTGSDHNGVSILGMDGLGKTVLAEAILADKRISGEFCCIRVPLVEGCFDFNKAIHQLELIVGNMGILKQQNQRLLMLFDNLLEIKLTQWNEFWKHMKTQCGAYSEIKILITSFNPRVSQTTRTAEFYLKRLSEENCKQVIVENALFFKKDLPKLHLSVVADTLATKCEGLPQLARILGMFLARDGMNDWRGRLNKDLRDMSDVRSEIVSTLRLSYLTMQPQLKRCLAYLALFPHKYSFIMDDLIHLLVAEGIIQHNEGKEYFSDLQGMSVLQHLEDINHTEKPKYELHKFSHIFSQLDASKICLRLEQCESSICDSLKIENVRHLSLLCGDIQPTTWTKLEKFKRLRTFVSLNDRRTGQVPRQLFKALVRRVLKLSNTDITALPDSIHRLKRLRSLDISFTPINKLPKTLCKLSNLQFFNLTKTLHLFHLPQQFHKLTNMLFLDWESSDINRLHLPSHIGKLEVFKPSLFSLWVIVN